MTKKIAILGAGSWGTALAIQAARTGADVMIWSRKEEITNSINKDSKNPLHLNHVKLPENISATNNIADAAAYTHILLAIPAQSTRQVLKSIPFKDKHSFIICSKGVEIQSLQLLSQVVHDIAPGSDIAILSGPNFAREVADGLPAVTSIASRNPAHLAEIAALFATPNFIVHCNDDIIGTQICGAAKNVIAIACGICQGARLGENAKAAILTKGLNEVSLLIEALGGSKDTILSPAGIGDFTLTCSSPTSRNMLYGMELASSKRQHSKLVEGLHAAQSIGSLARKHGLKLKLIEALERTIDDPSSATQQIKGLFA